MFFSIYTLGCKLNQLESESIADAFRSAGFSICPAYSLNEPGGSGPGSYSGPGIIVINTCTVTSMAEQKARRAIRKLLLDNPDSCLIITGCYAQLDAAALAALEALPSGRLFIIPGEKKDRIMDLAVSLAAYGEAGDSEELSARISSWLNATAGMAGALEENTCHPGSEDRAFRFRPGRFSFHSRAFIKIQDGCDRRCAYCRVSVARGRSRSLGAGEILSELKSMEERGILEAVLTGVNICQYKALEGGRLIGLPGLLDILLLGTSQIRLRLSSIEPDELSDDLLHIISNQRIRPHFHLSVQSGSARVLEKMGRPYTPEVVERAVERLRSVRDDPFLACDIIAGFPGESEGEFEETSRLCENAGFAWIHAFRFSRRPGTAAYHFTERVGERDISRRVEFLARLARKCRQEYISRWVGKEVEAVVEAGRGIPIGHAAAVSENYLKLLLYCGEGVLPGPGSPARCRIVKPFASLKEMPESGIIGGNNVLLPRFDVLADCLSLSLRTD